MIFWIAKHETKGEGGGDYYNQFRENQDGIPNHHNDGGFKNGKPRVGGFGVFQVTGNPIDDNAIIPRGQIWNWKTNVDAGLEIIKVKQTESIQKLAQRRQEALQQIGVNVAIPSLNLPRNPIDGPPWVLRDNNGGGAPANPKHVLNNGSAVDGIIIKRYNGAAAIYPGDVNGTGDFIIWHEQDGVWEFRRRAVEDNQPVNRSYVDRVMEEVE